MPPSIGFDAPFVHTVLPIRVGLADTMDANVTALALLTGLLTGALFRFLQIPIPAPPNLAGVMGIVGIFLGYAIVDRLEIGIDLLGALGL